MVEATEENDDFAFEVEDSPDVEIVDDTPPEDRGREPMPKELVEELEADELEEYSEKVKTRLKQMKKVWHDERREKEREAREKHEALSVSQRLLEENRRLKASLTTGETHLVSSYKTAAEMEAEAARKAFKEAYELGDSDKVIEAQEKLNLANYRLEQLKNYKPALQEEEPEVVNTPQVVSAPRLDPKTVAWQERNTWWGTDPEMTATALGLHQKLEAQNGAGYIGSDEYWQSIDNTMRRRFPEYFGETKSTSGNTKPAPRPATVVAPASRSTSAKKIVLKQSQVNLAKRLGLTPEQYAREFAKQVEN